VALPTSIGVVGHYNLLERLEPAGPGDLYRARDTRAGRTVTIRLLPPDYAPDDASRASVLEIARGLVGLSHPNVITLFEAGEHDGRIYLAFEYLKGQSLRAEMGGRPMNVRRAAEVAIQIADAVADAHAAGFIHGGLSPDTIVITAKGNTKIPAFELAARGGFVHGSEDPADVKLHDYDSPEEARGQPADERSDIYSIGAVLFEMLTTRRPSHRGAAAPSATNAHVPPDLDDIVLKAVAPNPDSRYQSAVTLAAELRSLIAILDVRGGAGDEEDEHHAPSTSLGRVMLIALLMLLIIGGLIWWFGSSS
jgi:eukaryotic-like serine/threonine-protein kinase